jgi:hypothetical protein
MLPGLAALSACLQVRNKKIWEFWRKEESGLVIFSGLFVLPGSNSGLPNHHSCTMKRDEFPSSASFVGPRIKINNKIYYKSKYLIFIHENHLIKMLPKSFK